MDLESGVHFWLFLICCDDFLNIFDSIIQVNIEILWELLFIEGNCIQDVVKCQIYLELGLWGYFSKLKLSSLSFLD